MNRIIGLSKNRPNSVYYAAAMHQVVQMSRLSKFRPNLKNEFTFNHN